MWLTTNARMKTTLVLLAFGALFGAAAAEKKSRRLQVPPGKTLDTFKCMAARRDGPGFRIPRQAAEQTTSTSTVAGGVLSN